MKEMKKAIIGLAFLSIAALPFSASAQNQADKSCNSKDRVHKQKQTMCEIRQKRQMLQNSQMQRCTTRSV